VNRLFRQVQKEQFRLHNGGFSGIQAKHHLLKISVYHSNGKVDNPML